MTMYEDAWDLIERLEETDPSTDDGRWGGSYCVHETYVGTPGGGDYICGLCEDGLTFFVKAPRYQLGVNLPGGQWFGLDATTFDDPSDVPLRTLVKMRNAITTLSSIVDGWQVKTVREGYWDDPFVNLRKQTIVLNHRAVMNEFTGDVHDIEAAIARRLSVPIENVFVISFDEEVRGLHSWIYADVRASVDRRELDERQLANVAAWEKED